MAKIAPPPVPAPLLWGMSNMRPVRLRLVRLGLQLISAFIQATSVGSGVMVFMYGNAYAIFLTVTCCYLRRKQNNTAGHLLFSAGMCRCTKHKSRRIMLPLRVTQTDKF